MGKKKPVKIVLGALGQTTGAFPEPPAQSGSVQNRSQPQQQSQEQEQAVPPPPTTRPQLQGPPAMMPPGPPGMMPPGPPGMMPQGPPGMMPPGPPGMMPQGPPGMMLQGPPGMMPPGMMPQGPPGMMPQGHPGMMPQGHPGMMSQGHPGMMPQGPPGMMPPGMMPPGMMPPGMMPPGMMPPGMMPQCHPGMMSQGPPGMMPQGPPGMMPQGPPGMMPQGPPGMMPQGPPGMMPQGPESSEKQQQQEPSKKQQTQELSKKQQKQKEQQQQQEGPQPQAKQQKQEPSVKQQQQEQSKKQPTKEPSAKQQKQKKQQQQQEGSEPQAKQQKQEPSVKQEQQEQSKKQPAQEPSAKQQKQKNQQQQQQKSEAAKEPPQKPLRDPSVVSTKSTGSSSDGSLTKIVENIDDMRVLKQKVQRKDLRPVLVRRGAQGTRGKKVMVEANFFRLLLDKLTGIAYHYDIAIEPDRPKKFYRPIFAQFCKENYRDIRFAYDGQKSAFTCRKVADKKAKINFQPDDGGKMKEYTVQLKEAAQIDLGVLKTYLKSNESTMAKPMTAIQCLDVVLRCAYENNPNFVRFKRSVYMVPSQGARIDLGKSHELWYGLFQSAILGSRPYLNVDVSHKAFPCAGSVLEVIKNLNRGSLDQLSSWVVNDLHGFLKGMDVVYKSPSGAVKRMRCNGLRDPASQQMFTLDDGTRLSVADYFAKRLNFRLRYPNLPVLHVGSTVRSVFVPAELCTIPPGQALNKNHPEECTREIIRYAATSTAVRKQKIMDLARQVNYNASPTLLDFGIVVGNEFEKVPARIIDAPPIQYARQDKVNPVRGVWRGEGKNFLVPSPTLAKKPIRWRILNLDSYTNEATVKRFGEMLFQQAKACDVQMEPFDMGVTYVTVRNQRDCLRELGTLLEGVKKQQPTITIVVLPSRGEAYAKVKQKAELASERIGLLTQCIKGMTVSKKGDDRSTLNNIMLKINAKTNGSNHCISDVAIPPLAKGKVMYIGADVTHPLGDDTPSVVGVAALYDQSGFRYNCSVRLQGARDEMIRDLENIVHRQLQLYQQANGALPEKIMYYRDGVSDGQFAEILTIELQALHAAIARVKPGYKPAVTFIVVQKRHHTRFFPHGNCPTEGRNGNVMPGTIVDSEITVPDRYEFYLVSHAAVQGVAKPTKYVVLYDDSNCNPDQLQAVTYNLCHLFARCNRAVSYPAPTYYAHLAAYRGRVYIKDKRINMNDLRNAYRDIEIISTVNDTNPMFFV